MITEMVYLGADNINELLISEDGQAVDFSGATRMLLKFEGSETVVDSQLSNEFITWDSVGRVILKLGELDIAPSKYPATLIVFDADHDDGQVLFHALERRVIFWFVPAD